MATTANLTVTTYDNTARAAAKSTREDLSDII